MERPPRDGLPVLMRRTRKGKYENNNRILRNKKEELQETVNEYGYTKEECKLLDESENTRFYDILALLEDSKEYYKSMGYKIGETIAMSGGRFALLLNY